MVPPKGGCYAGRQRADSRAEGKGEKITATNRKMSSNVVDEIYMGTVWFIILSLVWFSIFNSIRTYKSKIFYGIFGVVLLLLSVISALRVAYPSLSSGGFGGRYSGIGSLLAHLIFAIYSFFTAFSSTPLNTNQRFVLIQPPTAQAGGKRRK